MIYMLTVLHSYSLRNYPLEHILQFAQLDGWPAIELSGWHFDADNAHHDIGEAVAAGQRSGVGIYCTGYYGDFVTADQSARLDAMDRVRRVIDASAAHGVTLVNGFGGWLQGDDGDDWARNGSKLASDEHFRRGADAYHQLAAHAADRGVRVAIEVHPNTIHDTVASTARLVKLADHDNITVTVDPANAAVINSQDRDPDVIGIVADNTSYFHLKNCLIRDGHTDLTVDTAAGIIDNYRWLEKITTMPGIDAICLEYCGDGDPHQRLRAARTYLTETLGLIAATRG
jgi:sugar phosphate isomerase/epimerase